MKNTFTYQTSLQLDPEENNVDIQIHIQHIRISFNVQTTKIFLLLMDFSMNYHLIEG